MWRPRKLISVSRLTEINKTVSAYYSRRSDSRNADSYKAVKARKSVDDIANTSIGTSPNWELLAPRGYRFYLPGSIGPAWHDAHTTAHLEEFQSITSQQYRDKTTEYAVECVARECPMLLRRGVIELFPGTDLGGSNLTLVTLSQKTKSDLSHTGREVENEREKVTKFFVIAAQEICMKLRLAGYWADFINPFSGRPYLSPYHSVALCESNDKPQYLEFQIKDHGDCRIISNDPGKSRNFVGTLFTTAPASTTLLRDILDQ
ncbi:cobalamin trafficking protein CblD-like isoform X2 [Periplaneta americana]